MATKSIRSTTCSEAASDEPDDPFHLRVEQSSQRAGHSRTTRSDGSWTAQLTRFAICGSRLASREAGAQKMF